MNQKFFILIFILLLVTGVNFSSRAQEETSFAQIKQQNWSELIHNPLQKEKFPIIIANPDHDLVLVNKKRKLPAHYSPAKLVIPNILFLDKGPLPKKHLQPQAAQALEKLFNQAQQSNIILAGISGYRSYQRQKEIFAQHVNKLGWQQASQLSAQPGASEHQTGLAVDVSSPTVRYRLIKKFGITTAGQWLTKNAYKYGFIVRYPQKKEQITGYQYEPWHLRYVGWPHAKLIHEQNLTLEEYIYSNP